MANIETLETFRGARLSEIRSVAHKFAHDVAEVNIVNTAHLGIAGFNIPGTNEIYLDQYVAGSMPGEVGATTYAHEAFHAGVAVKEIQKFNPEFSENAAANIYSEVIVTLLSQWMMDYYYGIGKDGISYEEVLNADEVYHTLKYLSYPQLMRTVFNTEGVPESEFKDNSQWLVNNIGWAMIKNKISASGSDLTEDVLDSYYEEAWIYSRKTFGREVTDMEIHTPGQEAKIAIPESFKNGMRARMYHAFKTDPVRRSQVFEEVLSADDQGSTDIQMSFVERMHSAGYGYLMQSEESIEELLELYQNYFKGEDQELENYKVSQETVGILINDSEKFIDVISQIDVTQQLSRNEFVDSLKNTELADLAFNEDQIDLLYAQYVLLRPESQEEQTMTENLVLAVA